MKRAEGGFGNAGEGERMDLVESRAIERNAGEKRLVGPEEIDGAVGRRGILAGAVEVGGGWFAPDWRAAAGADTGCILAWCWARRTADT